MDTQPAASSTAITALRLTPAASRLARSGRLWFFRDDITEGRIEPPRLVRVRDDGGRDLGLALTAATKIAVRRCGSWPGHEVPDRETFFAARLEAAIRRRAERPELESTAPTSGVRLVHGESDNLPGLVVDRYGPVLVLQVTMAAVEQALDAIVPFLVTATGAETAIARNDVATRQHERLPDDNRLLHGRRRLETTILEHGVRHSVRPFSGHKTGFYLDQRPARRLIADLARGRTVLDLFSYQAGFSLAALRGGALSAIAVDQSAEALELAQASAADNQLEQLTTHQGNVFDFVREQRDRGAQYGLIVLDPPAFAKSRRELPGAERGYRDLNRLALRLLEPGGYLLTCTCSHHVTLPHFEDLIRQAAAGLPFQTVLRQRLGAGPDHPTVVTHPESEYLKVLLLQRQD